MSMNDNVAESAAATAGKALLLPIRAEGSALSILQGESELPLLSGLPPGASVRTLDCGCLVLGLQGEASCEAADLPAGQLHLRRFLALAKSSLYWMSPLFGSSAAAVPGETQFLLMELGVGGPFALALPLVADSFRASLRASRTGIDAADVLLVRLESGSPGVTASAWPSALLLAAGRDPWELVARGVASAAALSGGAKRRVHKRLPPSLDSFGWCTWDAFYSGVSPAGIQEGLRSLAAGGAPARFLVIDDGWQRTDVDGPYRSAAASGCLTHAAVWASSASPACACPGTPGSPPSAVGTPRAVVPAGLAHSPARHKLDDAAMEILAGSDYQSREMLHDLHRREEEAASPRSQRSPFSPAAAALHLASPRSPASHKLDDAAVDLLAGSDYQSREMVHDLHRREEGAVAGTPRTGRPPRSPRSPFARLGFPAPPAIALEPAAAVPAAQVAEAEAEAVAVAVPVPRPGLLALLAELALSVEAALLRALHSALVGAASDSWRMRAFAAVATGPLRQTLLRFYARTTEHSRRLTSLRANAKFAHPLAGPDAGGLESGPAREGLASVISAIKKDHGVKHVYAWHALMGFWAGLSPDAPELAAYAPEVVQPRPSMGALELDPSYSWVQSTLAGVGLPADPTALHRDLHAYLAAAGVDGVKVDVQGLLGMCAATLGGGPALTAAYHASLEASVREYFPGNGCINCMCGSSENVYRMTDTAIARVSDDYYPTVPASWCSHIAGCAYNSLFVGELVVPDWDMFHSAHESGLLHATARAVSGGPIYCSDRPGAHDHKLLRRLVLPDGSVLRALLPGRPTADCLFADVSRDGRSALKVWNLNPCGGMVACFNVQGQSWSVPHRGFHMHDPYPDPVTATVRPSDVPGLAQGTAVSGPAGTPCEAPATAAPRVFALWSDERQSFELRQAGDAVEVTLDPGGCDLLTIAPVATHYGSGVCFAPIGLVNLLNAGGAVRSFALSTGGAAVEPALPVSGDLPGFGGAGADDANASAGVNASAGADAGAEAPRASAHAAAPPVAELHLLGCGSFVAYCSRHPSALLLDGSPHGFSYFNDEAVLRFDVPAPAAPGTSLDHSVAVHF